MEGIELAKYADLIGLPPSKERMTNAQIMAFIRERAQLWLQLKDQLVAARALPVAAVEKIQIGIFGGGLLRMPSLAEMLQA